MSSPTVSSGTVARTGLDDHFHVCAFFDSRDEEYGVLRSFYGEGLARGEKAIHIVDLALRNEHRKRLQLMGIDVEGRERSGQLEVKTPVETYLASGAFDPDAMLATLDGLLATAKANGFPRTRIMGNMGWALDGAPGSHHLIEYETRVNEVLARTGQPAICVYDTARVSGALLLAVLRSHPLTLVDGVVRENPLFASSLP